MPEYIELKTDNGITIFFPKDKRKVIKYRVAPRDMTSGELQELGETLLAIAISEKVVSKELRAEPKKPTGKGKGVQGEPVIDPEFCTEKCPEEIKECKHASGGTPPSDCPQLKKEP